MSDMQAKLNELFEFLPKSKRSASFGSKTGAYPFFTSSNKVDSFVDDPDYTGKYLIIGDGGTGNCKYFDGSFSVSDHNYILRPLNNCNPICVNYFLKKNNFEVLNKGFKGVGIKNIAKSYIQNIVFSYNDKYSEEKIVKDLSQIENLINREECEIENLNSLIKSRFIGKEVAYAVH